MRKYKPEDLIHDYVNDLSANEERSIVESWHLHEIRNSQYIPSKEDIEIVHNRTWNNLISHIKDQKNSIPAKKIWTKIAIAASLLFITSTAVLIYIKPFPKSSISVLTKNDVAPGTDKATLILDNGQRVYLNQSTNEHIAVQGGTNIRKSEGVLIYDLTSQTTKKSITTNKLETPKGGKYQILLPDGSKVWLNSASTLTYPTSFRGKERKVTLDGEAYFEVAKDKERVFKVISGTQTIDVIGTHFNIRSYKDEMESQTTLAEGKVKISKGDIQKILKPGQAAFTNKHSKTIHIGNTDLEKDLAWKNNEFIFNGDDLKSIMRELSRWYDVEVVYDGNFNQSRYWGVVSRSKNISEVLKMLQLTGKINFKIEGRRITLMN